MISRRAVLAGAPMLLAAKAKRPNFLFLVADDHAGYVLGADGNRLARTPHLDRLAREGTRFAQHYCNSPVCTPSRQSFFTGLLPHATGVTRLPTPLSEDRATLARRFREAGYATAVFGKMHFNRPGRAGLHGFDIACTEDVLAKNWEATVKPSALPARVATKPPWRPFQDPARIWLNAEKLPYPRQDAQMKSCYLVSEAERFLEEHRDRPFALWASFSEPHSPYDFPVEYSRRYSPRQFTPYRMGLEDAAQIPRVFRDLTSADRSGIMAAYYTSVEFLDRNVGRLLEKLRALNLDRDTLVVYMADHGYCLGQHGRFEKHCGYDPALRVPLLMRWPGRIRRGVVRDLTEHVDVPATIADLLGIEAPEGRHGRSLRPYLEDGATAPRDHIFSEYLENEEAYIRTQQWKFIYCSGRRARGDGYITDNPTPGRYVRLYDLKNDPGEFTNVASANGEVVTRMRTLMLDRFRATHPESSGEPRGLSAEESLDWYLRPRDA
jgi:choline-sulfatase